MNQQGQIYKSMIAVMREIDFIPKDKKNPQQGYNFRGIDDMYNFINPLFKKHGIFILSEVLAEKREERATKSGGVLIYAILDVKFSFVAEDGSCVFSTTKGEAMDSGDKASNKAMSAALKYAIMQTFLIPTAELSQYNTENETHEPAPKQPANTKQVAMEKLKALPDDIRHGFKHLGLMQNHVWQFCEDRKWENETIKRDINKLLDERNSKSA